MAADDVRAEALRKIPAPHSLALRLRDAGVSDGLIAESLGIDDVAIGPLLTIADAKLAAVLTKLAAG